MNYLGFSKNTPHFISLSLNKFKSSETYAAIIGLYKIIYNPNSNS